MFFTSSNFKIGLTLFNFTCMEDFDPDHQVPPCKTMSHDVDFGGEGNRKIGRSDTHDAPPSDNTKLRTDQSQSGKRRARKTKFVAGAVTFPLAA